MNQIIDFFLKNKDKLADYFAKNVKVNNNKTVVKFGTIDGERVSISFLLEGEPDENITDYREKVEHLFNTDIDLSELAEEISKLHPDIRFSIMAPLTKINDNPVNHAFRITAINNVA